MVVDLETRILALENEVNLNIKELIIAFKRLKDLELRIEQVEVFTKQNLNPIQSKLLH